MELLREEMKQNAVETKNCIMEEFRSILTGLMTDKVKGEATEEFVTDGATLGVRGKGILPTPRELLNQGSSSSGGNVVGAILGHLMDREGMQKYLPKIELITFDRKEPRVWVRKCVKHFEVYKVPNEEKVGIASLFLIDRVMLGVTIRLWIEGHMLGKILRENCV